MSKRFIRVKETQHVDVETGEVSSNYSSTKEYTVGVKSEAFMMVFIDNMDILFNVKRMADMKVLLVLCSLAEYNTGVVFLTRDRRELLRSYFGDVSNQYISNCLSNLKKLDLISGSRDCFKINPSLFWKGTSNERVNNKRLNWKL